MNSKKEVNTKETDQQIGDDPAFYDTSIKLGDRYQAKIPNLDLGYGKTKDKYIFSAKGYYYKGYSDRVHTNIYTKQNTSSTSEEKLKAMFGGINEKSPNSIMDFINKNTLYGCFNPHIIRSNVFDVKREYVDTSQSCNTEDQIYSE